MSFTQNKRRKLNENNLISDSIEQKFYKLICEIEEDNNYYINYENVFKEFKIILNENIEGLMNRCTVCNEDMGRSNPRQLCGKTICYNEEN